VVPVWSLSRLRAALLAILAVPVQREVPGGGLPRLVRTSKRGHATIRVALPAGAHNYTVTARAAGYRTGRVRLTVR